MSDKKKQKNKEEIPAKLSDLEEIGVKGKVKKVEQKLFRGHLKSGVIVQGEEIYHHHKDRNFTMFFDEQGFKTQKIYRLFKDHVSKEIYNNLGQKIETHFWNERIIDSKVMYEYNEDGKILRTFHYNEDGCTSIHEYEYDAMGNNILLETFDKDKNPTLTFAMKYDERGFVIEDKRTKPDGTIEYWTVMKNDDHGNAIERQYLNPDGSEQKTEKNTYDYDADGVYIGTNGRHHRKDAKLTYNEFEHDPQGNWLTKVGFHKKIPVLMIMRDIQYFDESLNNVSLNLNPYSVKRIQYTMEKSEENAPEPLKEQAGNAIQLSLSQNYTQVAQRLHWLAEACNGESFSAVRYYAIKNNDIPSAIHFAGLDIEAIALLKELKKNMGASVIHSFYQDFNDGLGRKLVRYTLSFPDNGYLLQALNIQSMDDDEYEVLDFISFDDDFTGQVNMSDFMLYHPSDDSGLRDLKFEEELTNTIEMCTLGKVPDKPEISMVEVSVNGNFKLKSYPVFDNFIINDLDMHYGYGFEKFHDDLIRRFQSETRGLVLFHGTPGTGKTYYIRHLLRKMTTYNKVVIYMPPNMVDSLVDPVFVTFLSNEISRYSLQGYFCVLLIEDAEPLLASRQSEGRIQGISNLLNMTDGLLNDMLKLQIICTFNVTVKELDKALLRPGRLIARKEFRAMTALDANRLAQQLGVKHHFTKPATLAEVYSLVKNQNTLVHD